MSMQTELSEIVRYSKIL